MNSDKDLRARKVIVGGFSIVAVLLLLAGAVVLVFSIRFASASETTLGTVVEVSARQDCRTRDNRRECSVVYRPTITYTTAAGAEVTFTSNSATSDWNFPIGTEVNVRYDPANPQGARMDGWFSTWGAPTIVGGLGVLFAVVAVILRLTLLRGPNPGDAAPPGPQASGAA
ncbi:MAG: DUF3592 domain-containing protein [Propionibacteriaceae bacterium]